MYVSCVYCMLCGGGLCDGPIIRPGVMSSVCVCHVCDRGQQLNLYTYSGIRRRGSIKNVLLCCTNKKNVMCRITLQNKGGS
jgi:hypothetical protein